MNAIVTGASKGLGKAIAFSLAAEGYDLVLCSTKEAEIQACADEIRQAYGQRKIVTYTADLSKKSEAIALGKFALGVFRNIDVLINNAGRFVPGQVLEEADDQLELMLHNNLYSAYYLTKTVAPAMHHEGNRHIINMCSVASQMAYPNGGSYSISKFALLGFTKVLREELKTKGIKVTAIMPGATWSDSWKGVDLPTERLMQADDIAKVVTMCLQMSLSACVEEIVIRPQLGDL